ncbi:MAG TPA: hypothetical protein PKY86_06400 [Niabella sp.]|nr:hypothetical protein [Niabella sp.]HQW14367.1 hypothetical protein [Niabella sp.]HQX18354.1 hypothetical protein [Niabella sp.]HQX40154.1 hypothetical protein [Niabella sp.]HRB05879.1 hypothetical protein [Niabella sp.]
MIWTIRCITILIFGMICSCNEIGEQPPENIQLLPTNDGSKIVRQYSVLFVTSYSRTGNSVRRAGSSTQYLELYDAATGKLLSPKSHKLEGNFRLLKITNGKIWMSSYNNKTQKQEIQVLNLSDFSKAFDSESLENLNNGLGFSPNQIYYNPPGMSGIIMQGDDARIYQISEETGKASLLPDTLKPKHFHHFFLEMNHHKSASHRYDFEGRGRSRLVAKPIAWDSKEKIASSQDDFISPILVGQFNEQTIAERPMTIDGSFAIISKTKTTGDFKYQISLLDTTALRTKWKLELPASPGSSSDDELSDIKPVGDNLLLTSKLFMGLVNAKTGNWVWSKHFISEDEK